MRAVLKWAALTVAGVFLQLSLAIVAVVLLVDPNDYRDDIGRIVQEQTGHELVIEGDISLSFFPWLGLDLGRTRVENREGFGDEPFASIERAGVAVRLMPLLRRELVLDTVRLDGLTVNLVVNEAGRGNWDLDRPEPAEEDAPPPTPDDDAPAESGPPLQIGTIEGVRITDMRVTYDDRQEGVRHEAGPVNLRTGELRLDHQVPIDADWVVNLDDDTAIEGSLEAALQVDEALQRLGLELSRLDVAARGPGLPDGGLDAGLAGRLDADLEAGTATLDALRLDLLGLRLDIDGAVSGLQDDPEGEFALRLHEGDVVGALRRLGIEPDVESGTLPERVGLQARIHGSARDGLQRLRADLRQFDFRVSGGQIEGDGATGALAGRLDLDLAADTATLEALDLRFDRLRLNGRARARDLTGDPAVEGRFDLPAFNARATLERLGVELPPMADDEALTRVGAAAAFELEGAAARLRELAVTLDDTTLTGNAAVEDFAGPVVRFDLAATPLDLDRYLAEGGSEPGAGAEAVGAAADEDAEGAEIPMDLLRELDVEGQVRLESLQARGFDLTGIRVQVSGRDGRIRIHPLQASLYGGQYRGDIRLDATGEQLGVEVDERLEGVQAQPIVQQFLGRDLLRGRGDLRLRAGTRGLEPMEMLRELVGQIELDFSDGQIAGISLPQLLHNAVSRVQGADTMESAVSYTGFEGFRGRAAIDRGRLRSEAIALRSDLFNVDGGGELNVFDGTLDYRFDLKLVGELEGSAGRALAGLRDVPIPMRLSGALRSPDVRLDLAGALTGQQMERLREGREALEQRAREAEQELRERAERERDSARERIREEEKRARDRVREEVDTRRDEVRDRARDGLRRLLE